MLQRSLYVKIASYISGTGGIRKDIVIPDFDRDITKRQRDTLYIKLVVVSYGDYSFDQTKNGANEIGIR